MWNRTLAYFGIAEEDDWDEDGASTHEELERGYQERDRYNVRRLPQRAEPDGWSESDDASVPARSRSSRSRLRGVESDRGTSSRVDSSQKVHLVLPRSFNDAQQIADRFKDSVPVILNLQNADNELSKRLIDFASGLTYALDGSMQRVADKVFLLTPRNVELSAEERARALDRGGFFNQV
jgi:cell division inhibitor SepF